MRRSTMVFGSLFGLALVAVLTLAACSKEEKASPTAAVAKPTTAAVAPAPTTAATKVPEAIKAAEPSRAAASPTVAAQSWLPSNIDKLPTALASYLRKNNPNDPNNYKPELDVPPKYGGEIAGPFGTPATWDFIKDRGDPTHGPIIYSSFVQPALNRGDDAFLWKLKPDLMESWQQAPDGMSWTFKLRKGATWQNKPPLNGRPVTIQDMKYGLDLIRLEGPWKGDYAEIQDVVVVDEQTLKIALGKPFPDLLEMLGNNRALIIAKECYQDDECRKNKPVGSGAFMFESMEPRVKLTMVKNPDYWAKDGKGNKLPYLDRVVTYQFADPAATTAAFRTGKIDNLYLYGERDLLDMLKSNPNTILGIVPPQIFYVLNGPQMHFKWREGAPWMDQRVRLAMSMAIDRVSMIDSAHDGLAVPLQPIAYYQMNFPFFPGISELGKAWQYDPKEAKRLLAEAGYAKGFKVKVETMPLSGAWWNALLIWQQNWKDVGIEMDLVMNSDSAAFSAQFIKNGWEDLIYQYSTNGAPWNRPTTGAYNTLHSKGTNNFSKFVDAKIDDLLDKARVTYDLTERAKILRQVLDYEGENPHMLYAVAAFRFELMTPRTHRMASGVGGQVWGWGMRGLIETWVDK